MKPIQGYHRITPDDLHWRLSNLMKIPNADFPARTGSENMGARLWRMPPHSANTRHEAVVKFFNAYETHNRTAAKEVAADGAVDALVFNPAAGTNPTLQLIDDTHVYYEGGSIQLRFTRTAAGRWYVRSVTSRAD